MKKVIKTVFKPKPSKEKSTVRDELSSNLDDLLRTFEEEDPEPVTIKSQTTDLDPRPKFRGMQITFLCNVYKCFNVKFQQTLLRKKMKKRTH